jgi:hypothetical protein
VRVGNFDEETSAQTEVSHESWRGYDGVEFNRHHRAADTAARRIILGRCSLSKVYFAFLKDGEMVALFQDTLLPQGYVPVRAQIKAQIITLLLTTNL